MRPFTFLSFAIVVLLATEMTSAIPVYTYTSDKTTYSAPVGQPVTVHIFLYEKLSAGDQSLIDAESGLVGAGFAVTRASNQTNGGTLTAISGDSSTFDNGFTPGPSNSGTFMNGVNQEVFQDSSGPKPSAMGLISIGSVTIDASSVANTTTIYDLGAYKPGSAGYTEGLKSPFDDLDLTNNGGSGTDKYTGAGGTASNPISFDNTFSVTATPEPTSLVSFGLGLPVLARRRRRQLF